jgi:hypothetical protein
MPVMDDVYGSALFSFGFTVLFAMPFAFFRLFAPYLDRYAGRKIRRWAYLAGMLRYAFRKFCRESGSKFLLLLAITWAICACVIFCALRMSEFGNILMGSNHPIKPSR